MYYESSLKKRRNVSIGYVDYMYLKIIKYLSNFFYNYYINLSSIQPPIICRPTYDPVQAEIKLCPQTILVYVQVALYIKESYSW